MLKTILKTLICSGALASFACAIDTAPAEAGNGTFTYGGTFRSEGGTVTFFGNRAIPQATLSPVVRQQLGKPWQRTVPNHITSKPLGSSK